MTKNLFFTLFLSFVTYTLLGQKYEYRFHSYTTDDGLPSMVVNDIVEDGYGFLWVGTNKGISRFDAYDFKTFPFVFQDAYSHDVQVNELLITDSSTLWAATETGLFRIETQTEVVTTILDSTFVKAISPDGQNGIWIGTKKGLYHYKPETDALNHISLSTKGQTGLKIFDLLLDGKNRLWISTLGQGLLCLESGKITSYDAGQGISSDMLRGLAELPNGQIAIGTKDKGLNILNPSTGVFSLYTYKNADKHSISSNSAYSLLVDKDENLWVGTWSHGLNLLDKQNDNFHRFVSNPDNPYSVSSNYITTLFQSSDGTIWLGSEGGGLGRFHINEQLIIRYLRNSQDKNPLSSSYTRSVYEDKKGIIWIGTSQAGLNRYDPIKDEFKTYLKSDGSRDGLARGTIWSIAPSSNDDYLWLGTSRGIAKLNKKTGKISFIPTSEGGLLGNNVLKVLDDHQGNLWTGSWYGGLNKMDIKSGRFEQFTHKANDPTSLPCNNVCHIHKDSQGQIWVATSESLSLLLPDGKSFKNYPIGTLMLNEDKQGMLWLATLKGLATLNPLTDSLHFFDESNGLTTTQVGSILIADNGYVLFGSNMGVDIYEPGRGLIKHVDKNNGLASNNNVSRACWKGKNDIFYFGGIDGMSQIDLTTINLERPIPNIQFTDFLLFNKPVNIGDSSRLKQSVYVQKEIALGYKDYIFAFEFAAMDFSSPKNVQYEYMLEGLDEEWIPTDVKNRKAVYTNVAKGSYRLLVRAKAKGTKQYAENSIKIIVVPPWWNTWWAILLFSLGASLLIFLFVHDKISRIRKQKHQLEHEVRSRTAEIEFQKQEIEQQALELKAMNEQKDRLFSIISHDLRNPLSALKGTIPLLDPKILKEEDLERIRTNIGERIDSLGLVMLNLLDWSKGQLAGEKTSPEEIELFALGEQMIELYSFNAQSKGVKLFNNFPEGVHLYADTNQVQTILRNAIGNAVKFSKEGGHIHLKATYGDGKATIEVKDNGLGMDQEKISSLFSLATNVSTPGTSGEKGVGLGTLLIKEFAEKNGGNVWIESEVKKGTSVFFTIPLAKNNFTLEV